MAVDVHYKDTTFNRTVDRTELARRYMRLNAALRGLAPGVSPGERAALQAELTQLADYIDAIDRERSARRKTLPISLSE